VLHNLRGALDHTVYHLAVAQTRKDPPDDETRLAFPICSDSTFFEGQRYRIRSLNVPTQTAIERAQPYNRLKPGKWFMPLWWLAQMDDIDKHRLSHLSPLAIHPNEVEVGARPGTFHAEWNLNVVVDGTPIFRLTLTEPDPNVLVNLHATGGVVLAAEHFPPIGIYWMTHHLRREVGIVCRYLAGFFPRAHG
jgi:hypothetical protein